MESTETTQQEQHPKDVLQSCLVNLFQAPTKSIEDAFALVIDLVQNQNDKNQESLHKFERQNDELSQQLTKCQESNQSLKTRLDDMYDSISILKDERDDLFKQNEHLNMKQSSLEERIIEINEEVKTMAHNLQLQVAPETDCLVDEVSKTIDEESENGDENGDENDVLEEKENPSLDVEESIKQSEEEIELKPELPQQSSKSSSRRASVISRKLDHHETLAARLDRIENDKERVKEDLIELKDFVSKMTGQHTSVTLSEDPNNIVLEIRQRVTALEKFLEGFGVTDDELPFSDEESQAGLQEESQQQKNDESIAVSSNRKRSRSRDNEERNLLDDKSETEGSETENEDNQNEKGEFYIAKTDISVNDVNVAAIEGKSIASDSDNSPKNKDTFAAKSQGLLMHMIEQEARIKEDINSILQRLLTLEEQMKRKVYSESLNPFMEETKTQLDQLKKIRVDNIGVQFDDSTLNAKIEKIEVYLEELQKGLDSKLTKSDLLKELERHQSNNILTSLQSSNNGIDGEILKQLQHMIQNEIDTLRDQKLDKVAFTKEMEVTKSQITNNMTKSLSNQEYNFMKSITKVEIDINDCKDSINMLENLLETKYAEADDLNLDEKIKNATEAMESSLQEIISSRMNCLKAMEDEVEKIATGLAEKPDQDQINNMLRNLEDTMLKRFGKDDTFQSVLESMKAELKQKTTRKEVILIVKQMLNGAKEDVKRSSTSSLMIGRQPVKCLSCNDMHPQGVNSCLAPKVNHNSLPKGRGLVPTAYPYCKAVSTKLGKGALRPLYRSQSNVELMRRSRRSVSGSKKYSRRSR